MDKNLDLLCMSCFSPLPSEGAACPGCGYAGDKEMRKAVLGFSFAAVDDTDDVRVRAVGRNPETAYMQEMHKGFHHGAGGQYVLQR